MIDGRFLYYPTLVPSSKSLKSFFPLRQCQKKNRKRVVGTLLMNENEYLMDKKLNIFYLFNWHTFSFVWFCLYFIANPNRYKSVSLECQSKWEALKSSYVAFAYLSLCRPASNSVLIVYLGSFLYCQSLEGFVSL